MEYKYRVYEDVYNEMLLGKKNIEYRLLNEKSENINVGDTIKFSVIDNEEKYLISEVLEKNIYDDLDSLFNSRYFSSNCLNYTKEEFRNTFYNIFGESNVKNSKIVGFKIKII